jgi:hypothetical protein
MCVCVKRGYLSGCDLELGGCLVENKEECVRRAWVNH